MKMTKIFAGVAAAAIATSAMAVMASAYEAFLMYASGDWSCSAMDASAYADGNVDVTADGTYTVSTGGFMFEDEDTAEMVPATATGVTVFCVDIDGLATAMNAGKDAVGYDECETGKDKQAFAEAAGISVTDVIVTTKNADGTTTDIAVDQDNVIFGDIEGNGKIRIEIYNAYGDTVNAAPIDPTTVTFDDTMSVTFTISGIGGGSDAAVDTDAPVAGGDKASPDTGVEGVAAVAGLAVVAAGAVVLSKKRK